MEFSHKLQQLRKQTNLTQEELAQRLYVSRTAISKWESGRGYPSIDSLKAISQLFSISLDDLLSGEELLCAAKSDQREKVAHMRRLTDALLDCATALLLFLPFFSQEAENRFICVSLLALNGVERYLKTGYLVLVAVSVAFGIVALALQNLRSPAWKKIQPLLSLLISIGCVLVFIASRQPYAAAFVFLLLLVKGALLIYKP